MTGVRRALRRDQGATLVEFAFVGPILFLLLIAMLDIGLVVLGKSVASGAAREGARVGIIHFDKADDSSKPNYALVKAAVETRLVGLVRPGANPFVVVTCLDGATKATKACTRGAIRVDFDLIEVNVKWDGISASAGLVVPTGHSDKARMVIVGDGTGGTITPPCVGTGVMAFSTATPPPVGELDIDTSVTLTINRTGSTACTSSVTYTTANNTATAPSDYEAQTNLVAFAPGDASETISIVIKGDNNGEPSENFTVTLSGPVGGSLGSPATSTVTITDDDGAAPQLLSLQMFDVDTDGKVDRVVATFDQALNTTCANQAAFVFTGVPSGGSKGTATISGTAVTIPVTEGGGPPDTAVGSFTVQLNPGCVTASGSGLAAAFPATAPADKAKPVLINVVDTDIGGGSSDGKAQQGDFLTLTFSEAMATAVTPRPVIVGAGPNGQLSITGIISTMNLNPKNKQEYAQTNDLTFASSVVTTTGAQVKVTLGACTSSPSCAANALQGQSDNTGLAFNPAPSLTDLASPANTATGTFTISANNYPLF